MEMATSSVEFSFNDIMHRQIDGVAMGSLLGPALANIFVGYYESKLFQTTSKPEMYSITAIWMTPSEYSATKMNVIFS